MRSTARMLTAVLTLTSFPCRADDSKKTPTFDVELVPMRKGDVSLFDGVLLPPEAIATIITDYSQFDQRLQLELQKVQRDDAIKLKFELDRASADALAEQAVLRARNSALTTRTDLLLKENQRLEKRTGRAKVWIVLSALAGAVVSGLAFFGAERALR